MSPEVVPVERLAARDAGSGWTVLHLAASRNDAAGIHRALARGRPVDQPTRDGWSALMVAARYGAVAAVRTLLAARADADREVQGLTAGSLARHHGHLGVERVLVGGPTAQAAGRFHVETRRVDGLLNVVLGCGGPQAAQRATIAPEVGGKLNSWRIGGREILHVARSAAELRRDPLFGAPVMYPTPNRVAHGRYQWRGRTIDLRFPDEPQARELHGPAFDDTWSLLETRIEADAAIARLGYELTEANPRFQGFPFRNTLILTYRLHAGGLSIGYEVSNLDRVPFAYGLGFHPLLAAGRRDDLTVRVEVPTMLAVDADFFPLGGIEPVRGAYDLRAGRRLSEIRQQAPYYPVAAGDGAVVSYADGLRLSFSGSAEFRHLVVWNPARTAHQAGYFAIENQTCSPDAHNFHASGHPDLASLIEVPPGGRWSGQVDWRIDAGSQD